MKGKLILTVLATVAISLLIPELPAYGQFNDHAGYGRRKKHRSTWAPVRRPRRSWQQNRTGLYLGAGILGDYVGQGDEQLTQIMSVGGGWDAFAGYRVAPSFALEVGYAMSMHPTDRDLVDYDSAVLNGLTIDLKFFFIPESTRFEPYFQGGVGFYNVKEEGFASTQMQGGGFQVGGGIDFRLSRMFAIGARALYKGMSMDNETTVTVATESVYHNHATLEANIQLHF
jgi:hypothetical protein